MSPLQLLFGLFNFIICSAGIALVGLSSWLLIEPESFFELIEGQDNETDLPSEILDFFDKIDNGLWLTLTGAIALVLIGFLGCCGAFKKSACMLNTYAIVMVISILVQISSAVVVFWYSSDVNDVVTKVLEKYNPVTTDADELILNNFVDNLQRDQECCGWSSPEDYTTNTNLNQNSSEPINLPTTCCSGDPNSCTTSGTHFTEGCSKTLAGMGWTLGGIVIGVVVLEALATFSACYIKKKDKNFA